MMKQRKPLTFAQWPSLVRLYTRRVNSGSVYMRRRWYQPAVGYRQYSGGGKAWRWSWRIPTRRGGPWVHWTVGTYRSPIIWKEHAVHGTEGWNDFRRHAWVAPSPTIRHSPILFKVYALDSLLDLPGGSKPGKAISSPLAFGDRWSV